MRCAATLSVNIGSRFQDGALCISAKARDTVSELRVQAPFTPAAQYRIDASRLRSRVRYQCSRSRFTLEANSRGGHSQPAPRHFHAHWYLVLGGDCQKRGRFDFEIGHRRRNRSRYASIVSLSHTLEWNLLVLGCLAGKLDLQIGMNSC